MKRNFPPGPKGHFLLGSLKELAKDSLEFTTSLGLKYPGIAHFRFLRKDWYVVSSPEYMKQILQTKHFSFQKSRHYKVMKLMLGNGLVSSEGDFWKKQRRLSQPAFYKSSLEAFVQTFAEEADKLAKRWEEDYAGSSAPVEIMNEMSGLALQIVGRTLLSVDFSKEALQFKQHVKNGLLFINKRNNSFLRLPLWYPSKNNRIFNGGAAYMNSIIYKIIDQRLEQSTGDKDLLNMYLSAVDEETGEKMSREQLRDEVMTIFVAGFETVAIALTWIWYLLSENPKVAQKLYEEVLRTNPRDRTLESWFAEDYISLVIKEGMRLYPPVYNIGRSNVKDVMIGPYHIPKGGIFLLNTMALHRHPQVWNNPDEFCPERFLDEDVKKMEKSAFIPFGAGQRMCIGNNFAMLEMKVVLQVLVRKFALQLKPGHPVKPSPAVTLNPKYGMMMFIKRREQDN